MAVPVIVDANFMTVPAQFGVDVFAEAERVLEQRVEFIMLSSVLKEIEVISEGSKSQTDKRAFGIARSLADRCKQVDSIHPQLPVDDQLLEYTISVNGVLATNDRNLRINARKKGVPVLFLRGKKRLVLDGFKV
ncbi:MAG: PIN domain-containing protein [Promethearchaeota archaeon]